MKISAAKILLDITLLALCITDARGNSTASSTCSEHAKFETYLAHGAEMSFQDWVDEIENQPYNVLIDQLRNQGGFINKLDLHEFEPGNNGIIATEAIKAGDIVLKLPRTMIITEKDAKQSPTVKLLLALNLQKEFKWSVDHNILAIFLMEERLKPNSIWASYLAMLPKDWSSHALLFDDDDLAWLEGSELMPTIKNRIEKETADYELIVANFPDFGAKHSLREFLETIQAISSRNFGMPAT